jgi:hypothetical protein
MTTYLEFINTSFDSNYVNLESKVCEFELLLNNQTHISLSNNDLMNIEPVNTPNYNLSEDNNSLIKLISAISSLTLKIKSFTIEKEIPKPQDTHSFVNGEDVELLKLLKQKGMNKEQILSLLSSLPDKQT